MDSTDFPLEELTNGEAVMLAGEFVGDLKRRFEESPYPIEIGDLAVVREGDNWVVQFQVKAAVGKVPNV